MSFVVLLLLLLWRVLCWSQIFCYVLPTPLSRHIFLLWRTKDMNSQVTDEEVDMVHKHGHRFSTLLMIFLKKKTNKIPLLAFIKLAKMKDLLIYKQLVSYSSRIEENTQYYTSLIPTPRNTICTIHLNLKCIYLWPSNSICRNCESSPTYAWMYTR